jgi:hypothetical protein
MRIAAAAMAAALLLVAPAAASAEQRSGSATDAVGDGTAGPSLDIIGADAQYDSDGEMIVAAHMNAPIDSGPESYLEFHVAHLVAPDGCGGDNVAMYGFSNDQYSYVRVTGSDEMGSEPIAKYDNTVVFAAQGNALANQDYRCMTLIVELKGSDTIVDQLDIPLWFDGFAPPPPPPPPPPAATCTLPKLKGKTLAAAKRAITKAGCELGHVKKPKHGKHLVVKKATKKGSKINLVLGPKPRGH